VGADRKGPLAAFVVIAIIAAILLVTSVRSQAAPGWLDPDQLPATVVAAPPVTDPKLWGSVTEGVRQVVRKGAVLVHKATSDPSEADDPSVTITSPVTQQPVTPAATTRHRSRHHRRSAPAPHTPPEPPSGSGDDTAGDGGDASTGTTGPPAHDHGRHLGWTARTDAERHGHGRHLGWVAHGS
jgi:hypothetical protein